ncbi:MAG: TolC family protein [Paludibacter sp.]|nr:TolC family protein [Paludibacter sp.]
MRKYIITIVLLIMGLATFAQTKAWNLKTCIEFGLTHSSTIKKQQAQVEIYKQNYKEAVGGLFPSLKASSDGTTYFGRVLDKDNYKYVNTNTVYNEYQIYSSVTLFDGFSQVAKVRMERMNKQKGLQQLQLRKDMLAYEIMELFFNVQYYQGTVKLADDQLWESFANLKKVQKMEELGLKSKPDIAEIEAKASQDSFLLVKQQNLLQQEIIKLKNKINFPVDSDIIIKQYDSVILVGKPTENAFDIYKQALSYSPQIKASEQTVKVSEQAVNEARGNLFPTLSLYGGYNTYFTRLMNGSSYTPFRDQLNNNQNYYVGLSLSVPIFTGFSRQSAVQRNKQQLVIAKYEFDDTRRTLYSDIEQTVADVKGKAEEYIYAQKQCRSMQTAHEANLKKYEMGMISALELNTSANRLLQAQVDELNTSLQYQLKSRMLNYYKGNSFY